MLITNLIFPLLSHLLQTQCRVIVVATKFPRTAPFWVITQRAAAVSYQSFGKTYLQGFLNLEEREVVISYGRFGIDRLSRNVDKELPLLSA
jgi:hypothetical protein